MVCRTGCIEQFVCGEINLPHNNAQSEVFSPWVKAKFKSSDLEITVGNDSAVNLDNTVCIKSFEFGFSDGWTSTLEIIDEKGGAFPLFIDNIVKCAEKAHISEVQVEMQWGWTSAACNGSTPVITSPTIIGTGMHLEINQSGGVIKYNINIKCITDVSFAMREDAVFGESGKPMPLQNAIQELCKIEPIIEVEFARRSKDGKRINGFEWKGFGEKGPSGVWKASSLNRLSVISSWIESFNTSNDKGIVLIMDSTKPNTLVLWEDLTNECNETSLCDTSVGTFLVNAGGCSNVLEFNPTINWVGGFTKQSSGGVAGGAIDSKPQLKEDGRKPCSEQGKNVGIQETIIVSDFAVEAHGFKNAGNETNKAQSAHQHADIFSAQSEPIEADLRIIGDPRPVFINIAQCIGKFISIVAINPFHILGQSSSCGDWLASPGCNPILSNKNWMIKGINHSIQEGSYVTVLKLYLAAPGIKISKSDPLGGSGSGGYTPRNLC